VRSRPRCVRECPEPDNEVAGAVAAGELAAPVDGARVAPVLRSDIAPAIAAVLTEDGHEGNTYDLTGQDAVSWAQLAELLSPRAGKPVPYREIDEAEAAARMAAAGNPGALHPVAARVLIRLPRRLVGHAVRPHRAARRPARDAHPGRDRGGPRRHRQVTRMQLGIISLSDRTADPYTPRPVAPVDRLDATLAYARAADEQQVQITWTGRYRPPLVDHDRGTLLSPHVATAVGPRIRWREPAPSQKTHAAAPPAPTQVLMIASKPRRTFGGRCHRSSRPACTASVPWARAGGASWTRQPRRRASQRRCLTPSR
jgi:hypothetical protein